MTTKSNAANARDQILSGLKMVIDEAQRLLDQTDDRASESTAETRDRLAAGLRDAKAGMTDVQEQARATARQAAAATQRYVRSNPWTAVGVGAVAGIVVGILLGRR